jgi:flagellar motility protein MotE (MotC chaperone)
MHFSEQRIDELLKVNETRLKQESQGLNQQQDTVLRALNQLEDQVKNIFSQMHKD